MECHFVYLINRIVAFLLGIATNKISFSEQFYRFLDLPPLKADIIPLVLIIISVWHSAIWSCHNLAPFQHLSITPIFIARHIVQNFKFRACLDISPNVVNFCSIWAISGLCPYNADDGGLTFDNRLSVDFYI